MDLGLKGKKVILTGGSRGIGRACVELFAAEGADVAFCSRNAEQVAETAASLAKHGGTFEVRSVTINGKQQAFARYVKS